MIDTVKRVLQLIDERNMTLNQLCVMSGINHSTISTTKRRNGQLQLDTIDRICTALDISLASFFDVSDSSSRST